MRAIVFGAKGTLGRALVDHLPAGGVEVVIALSHQDCNILDERHVRALLANARPDVAFNAAAFTDVDGAEGNADEAFRANAIGPEVLARACHHFRTRFVHYSTDFVFDGEQERPYDEFDPPSPQGVYARSKLAGERLVLAATPRAFVLRVGCLYGHGGRNFPSTILRRLKAGETVRADRDRIGSPTWVVPVAAVSAALARSEHYGLYHCTANGETSWADYARFLAAELGLPDERVQALPTGSLSLRAPRPRRAVLDNRMLRLRDMDTLGDWQSQARAFMASEARFSAQAT
jgi:dTDP-4-dehydrorhamnose reductase